MTMHWLSIIGIGIAANLDNLGIGIAFGAKRTLIPFRSNLLIALLSMAATCVAMLGGHFLADFLDPDAANSIGGALIAVMGLLAITSGLREASRAGRAASPSGGTLLQNPLQADRDGNQILSWSEGWALGLALSLNCIASGIGAGATGLSVAGVTLSIGIFSLATVGIGAGIGVRLARTWLGRYSNAIGGLLLAAIGLYEIFI
ncbi:manganese efflux pump [Paenibacillus sp. D51F]